MSTDLGRVLHLFANYKWTGPADPAIRAATRLRELGVDAVFAQAGFVHPGGEHRVAEELWNRRMPVVTGLELRKHFHPVSLLRDVATLRHIVVRDRVTLLHCHQPADHLIAALACRRLASPPPIVRSTYEPEAPPRGLRERYAFGRTRAVFAPTPDACDGVVRAFGLRPDDVMLQEPVTEPRQLEGPNLRAAWGLGAEHRVVGITARIQPHRRFDLLWATARFVVDAIPSARFVLLGRGNDEDTQKLVTEPVKRLGLVANVLLPGYQKGAAYEAALRSLDVFLFLVPGSDGTCRAVCDAMAFGLPVVSTKRGILPSLVAARRAGEVPGVACDEEPAALGGVLIRLLRADAARRDEGRAALRRARLDMDPVTAARTTIRVYERVLGRVRGGGP